MDHLPPNYHQVLYWKISDKAYRIVLMNLLSIPLFIFWGILFFWLVSATSKLPKVITPSSPAEWLSILIAILLVTILHELVHGFTMRFFGARPKYGILWKALAFYATAPDHAFPRRQYLIVSLAPLILLSLGAVLLITLFFGSAIGYSVAFGATLNAAGAIGDLWITAIVLRFPAKAYVIDERDGIRIYLPSDTSGEAVS